MEREGQGGEQESSQGGIEEEGEQRRQEGLERLVPHWLTLSLDRSMKIGRSLVCGNIEGTLSERRLKDIFKKFLTKIDRPNLKCRIFVATPRVVLHFSIEIKMKKAADLA